MGRLRRANNRSRLSAATPSLPATPWFSLARFRGRLRARRRAGLGRGQTADNAERYSPYARPTRRANNRSRLSAATPSLSATPWLSLARFRGRLRARRRAGLGQGQTADNAERYSPYARPSRRAYNRSRLYAVITVAANTMAEPEAPAPVGWVERSDTHAAAPSMGIAALNAILRTGPVFSGWVWCPPVAIAGRAPRACLASAAPSGPGWGRGGFRGGVGGCRGGSCRAGLGPPPG